MDTEKAQLFIDSIRDLLKFYDTTTYPSNKGDIIMVVNKSQMKVINEAIRDYNGDSLSFTGEDTRSTVLKKCDSYKFLGRTIHLLDKDELISILTPIKPW